MFKLDCTFREQSMDAFYKIIHKWKGMLSIKTKPCQ